MACESLPIWPLDERNPLHEDDCSKDLVARKIYAEVADSVVQIDMGSFLTAATATGFFVGKGDEIITNAHVAAAAGRSPLRITTHDGKHYQALIEAADDIADVAVLKVLGLKQNTYKPLPFKPSSALHSNDDIFVLGHPGGRSEVYISPGQFQDRGKYWDFLKQTRDSDLTAQINHFLHSKDNDVRTRAESELNAPRLGANTRTEGGSSGSPVVDLGGNVIGVHADHVPKNTGPPSLEVPSEKAMRLMDPNSRSRQFTYEMQSNISARPFTTVLEDAAIGLAALRYPRAGMVALSGLAVFGLPDDWKRFDQADQNYDKGVAGLAVVADLITLGGAAASMFPTTRKLGLVAYSLGILGGFGQDAMTRELTLQGDPVHDVEL